MKGATVIAAMAIFAGLLTGCSAARAHGGEQPGVTAATPQGGRVLKDIAYGADRAQRLDVYLPVRAQHAPVIFMVHGGAWRGGDKAMGRVVDNKVARWVARGFVFVSVNYRMLPDADPLTQASDVARALAYAQDHAPEWGADPAKFIVMGHSAGAHLVDLLAAAPAAARHRGVRPWLGTVSLDSAAMDIATTMQGKHFRFYDRAFGQNPAYWKAVSPAYALTRGAGPMLLICSGVRPDAPCAQAKAFAAHAADLGVRAEVVEEALSHEEINATLGLPGPYTDAVEAFMRSLDPLVAEMLARP